MSVQTLAELFLAAVTERPRPDCFSYRDATGSYVDVSSAEVHRRVRALRCGLEALDIKPQDKVALLSENRLEWALADLAILCAGAVTVPIYPTLLAETIQYILQDCRPEAIFVSTRQQAEKIDGLRRELPFLRHVISFDPTDLAGVTPLSQLMQRGQDLLAGQPLTPGADCVRVSKNDLASIIYTSGTTGNPKGVMLSHWNFVSNVLAALEVLQVSGADRCLSFLPLSHVLERMAGFYTMLSAGVGIAYAEKLDTVPRDLLDVRPTVVVSVPRLYEKIYARVLETALKGSALKKRIFFWARDVGRRCGTRSRDGLKVSGWLALENRLADRLVFSKLRARTGGRLRFFISGGAPLAPVINEFFYAAGMIILEGYGLTETSPVLAVNTFDHFRIGSVGPPLPNTEIRIAEDGEILARGPQVMLGYWNNEAATREVLSPDGWFATGDIGHLDEQGFLYITDRKKDLIVTSGGKNVAPQPIENNLKESKYVSQAVVIGDRRPYLSCLLVPNFESLKVYAGGKGIAAAEMTDLLRHPDILALYQDLLAEINAKLPGFNQLKTFALLPRELTLEAGELTPTLKVKRWAITSKYAAMVDGMYAGRTP